MVLFLADVKKKLWWFFFLLFLKELLDSLHERYEEWLIKKSKFHVPAPVVVSVAGMECIDMYNIKRIVQFQFWINNSKLIIYQQY